jgi:hypothetical protein
MKCYNKNRKQVSCGDTKFKRIVYRSETPEVTESYGDRMAGTTYIPNRNTTGGGPGTELKKLLGKIGLAEQASCQCNSRAQQMDANGPQWCRDNLDTIVGWLREEAERRGLPFVETGARLMVKLAIRRAS